MAMPHARLRCRRAASAVAALSAVLVLGAASAASAQTAAVLYERAQAQEKQLAAAPSVEALRRAAKAYETVVLRHPTSGYCDNALWQAALLLERAWKRASDTRDRDGAVKDFTWLAREYPYSSLKGQAASRAAQLKQAPAARTTPAAVVRRITRTDLPRGDRVTVELSEEVAFTDHRVADDPTRIYFDFPNAQAAASVPGQLLDLRSPQIKTVRIGSPVPGVTRVVLDLAGELRYSAFQLYSPFRVVIDVEATTAAGAPPPAAAQVVAGRTGDQATAKAADPLPSPVAPSSTGKGDYSLARQLGLSVAKIVIDPGHGGHDPGAISNGVTESELVLDIALRLEKLLQQTPGIEVVLTRRTNEFIPLEERTAIANRDHADLFLSIHANSHRQPAVRGIETYFLNFATNPDAEAVAARENAASVQSMGTLPAILKAIALNNKLAESREFATLLQTSMMRRMRPQSTAIKDLGVKQAPFVVLIGAQMPSVLTEIAFLTNKAEAGLVRQPVHRQLIAQALRDAIVKYQDSLKRVSTSASQSRQE